MKITHDNILDFIQWLFEKRGTEIYLGEKVTVAEHMLQTAHFAEKNSADQMLIVAALLHDVGHFTNEFGDDYIAQKVDNRHEEAGSLTLAPFFPKAVTEPIRLHVTAKKYLCSTDPTYYRTLSNASKQTLELQGGSMNDAEKREFENNPYFEPAIKLRHWDDAGKVSGMKVARLTHYFGTIERVRKM